MSDRALKVGSWHGTDQARCLLSSRYWGVSGHIADMLRPPPLTHKRHDRTIHGPEGSVPLADSHLGLIAATLARPAYKPVHHLRAIFIDSEPAIRRRQVPQ